MRRVAFTLTLSLLGCAGPNPSEPARRSVEPIVDGYVDDASRGVVGLAYLGTYGHCSGSLITPNLVITARHCVAFTNNDGPGGSVVCGQTGFNNPLPGGFLSVSPETVRPDGDPDSFYKGTDVIRIVPGANDVCGFDVALLILEGEGIPAEVATPIIPRIDSSPKAGDRFSAIGFGLTDPDPDAATSGTRMRIDGNEVTCTGEDCASIVGGSIKATEWQGTARTCPGDSGGPAIDDAGRVMGVLSRGPQGCLSSVYGDVGSWGDFIGETAIEAAELGGIEPPFWAYTGESTPPPLGEPCSGPCRSGYQCLSNDGTNSGTCVPPCGADQPPCPSGYQCSTRLGVCSDEPELHREATGGGGCSTAPRRPRSMPVAVLFAALAFVWMRRRALSRAGLASARQSTTRAVAPRRTAPRQPRC